MIYFRSLDFSQLQMIPGGTDTRTSLAAYPAVSAVAEHFTTPRRAP